ncbi:hypothetical protein [Taibaiella koreensis]|uniref:hypothetical protein n=1 Tax=Taibaiella koreensis TaxID=1268548 RepID=UPI000E599996|nr:hypothetical protein [Taibaiella koreensis]
MDHYNIAGLLPSGFADQSRVWIYQSSRLFSEKEEREIDEQLHHFYAQWQAHGAPVKGWAKLLFRRFIVLMADETEVGVSGCSTDSSVRVIKSIERQYEVNLFDRLSITFLVKEQPEVLPMSQVQYAIDKGYINGDTLLFNNLVATKAEMLSNWLQPLNYSWLRDRIQLPVNN